jgi:hypothetical protein
LPGGQTGVVDAGEPAVARVRQVAPGGRQSGTRELPLGDLRGLAQVVQRE